MDTKKLADYLSIVKNYYPNIKKCNIVSQDYGWDYFVLIVHNKIVFRFPRDERASKSSHVQAQFTKAFDRYSNLSIPQPKIHKDNGIYATYPLIKGDPLKPIWLRRCKPSNQNKIAQELGIFLKRLHSFSIPLAQKIGVQRRQACLVPHDSTAYFKIHLKPFITSSEWEKVKKRLKEIRGIITQSNFTPVVTHNDITSQHILFDRKKEKLLGIIDFGDLAIGDPATDFFRLHIYPKNFVKEIQLAYGKKIDALFFEREKAYQDLTIMHRLSHYIKGDNKRLTKTLRNEFNIRFRRL